MVRRTIRVWPVQDPYNRWKRWSDKGVFAGMLMELFRESDRTDTLMIAAIHLKTHRTASSLVLKKGGEAASSAARKAA